MEIHIYIFNDISLSFKQSSETDNVNSFFNEDCYLCYTFIHAFGQMFYNVSRFCLSVDYFSKMTSLKDEVPRSELVCMLAVPAAYTIHDLVKFTAPVG